MTSSDAASAVIIKIEWSRNHTYRTGCCQQNAEMDLMDQTPHGSKETVNKEKKVKKKNLRFKLSLTQTSDNACPEFSYVDLVKEANKKNKTKLTNGSHEENDPGKSEAEALAQYYEAKYGGAPIKKKRKRDRAKDLADVGYGYDETDPFVDNSECYDEVVPTSLTTQLGGFYINSGKLEFKHISDDSNIEQDDDEDDDESLPLSVHLKKRRKFVSDSDESGGDYKDSHILSKKKKGMKRKGSADIDKRRRKLSLQGKDKIGKLGKGAKKKQTKVQLLVAKAKAQHHLSSSGSDKSGTTKLSQHGHSLSNGRSSASASKGHERDLLDILNDQHNLSSNKSGSSPDMLGRDLSFKSPDADDLPLSIPNLVKEKISSLTKIAKSNEKEGKMKFFSPDVNKLLLGIEAGSQNLSNRERSGIYQHLTPHVPCSKDTLIKRMKKLHATKQDESLKQPLELLKKEIDGVMNEQIARYDHECAAQQLAKSDDRAALAASTDEDDDGTGTQAQGEEKTKRTYAPRRKFKWSEKLRELLHNVVKIKLEQFESKQRTNQTAEEHLKNFFENEVKYLWPKGWMQARTLFKESRECHGHLTGSLPKQKKMVGASKKTLTTTKTEKKLGNNFASTSPAPASNSSTFRSSNESDSFSATKASKQLFRDHKPDSGLCVSMNLDCDPVAEKLAGQKQSDLMHRAIASAQREAAAQKRTVPVKTTSLAKETNKGSFQPVGAVKDAPKLPHVDDRTIKVWHEANVKPSVASVSKPVIPPTRDTKHETNTVTKPSHMPSASSQSISKVQTKKTKAPGSHSQSAVLDQYNSDLLKYAMMLPPTATQMTMDKQMLDVFSSMRFPPLMSSPQMGGSSVDNMANFIKMQQAVLQNQLQQTSPSFNRNLPKSSPQSKPDTFKPTVATSKKTSPVSSGVAKTYVARSPATEPFVSSKSRQPKHASMHKTPSAATGATGETQKSHSVNGAVRYIDTSPRSSGHNSTVSKTNESQKKQTFVAPTAPPGGRYSMVHTTHAISRSPSDIMYMKGNTSPLPQVPLKHVSIAHGVSTAHAPQTQISSSSFTTPVYPYHNPVSIAASSPFSVGSMSVPRSSAISPLPSKTSPSHASFPTDAFLKFNQLPNTPLTKGPTSQLDRDKAAMDALLSAHLQGNRR
uniref:Ubinuclein-2 n=1 Tax=Phallusia mammillata TaxID=59560 RepID=A0A6F9DWW4_9ASCI|nr:ubinuclein-2 [Phallusia mammillata]